MLKLWEWFKKQLQDNRQRRPIVEHIDTDVDHSFTFGKNDFIDEFGIHYIRVGGRLYIAESCPRTVDTQFDNDWR